MNMKKLSNNIYALILKARASKVFTIITWSAFILTPLYLVFMIELFNFSGLTGMRQFYANTPSIIWFSIILLYLIYSAFFLLTRRMWAAAAITGTFGTLAALVNFFKSSLTGDNFYPRDFVLVGELGRIVGFVSIPMPIWGALLIGILAFIILWFIIFGKKITGKLKWYITLPSSFVIFFMLAFFFTNAEFAQKIFNRFNIYFESTALLTSAYEENGFIAAFSVGVAQYSISKPDGFSQNSMHDVLTNYTDIPPDKNYLYPDIILVLSESFWDPRELPASVFSDNPLPNFDRLIEADNSISGNVFVPSLGGGTIRVEFEILTGLSVDVLPSGAISYNIIRDNIPTYISRYKDMGYDTFATHTYYEKFYNRNICLPLLGFDDYWGLEKLLSIQEVEIETAGNEISDKTFIDYLIYFLNSRDIHSPPYFLFGISMEGHQPYNNKYESFDITAYNPMLNADDLNRYQNFTQYIKNADAALGRLTDYINTRDRPTVLVWFGDHLPSIGVNASAFLDTGYVLSSWQEADRAKLYAPPFLIYANFELKQGMFSAKKNNEISSYNLLNALSRSTGGGSTPYMRLLEELHYEQPFFNVRLNAVPSDKANNLIRNQYYVSYGLITGNH